MTTIDHAGNSAVVTDLPAASPEQVVIVAHFYDVESGRTELAQRGRCHASCTSSSRYQFPGIAASPISWLKRSGRNPASTR